MVSFRPHHLSAWWWGALPPGHLDLCSKWYQWYHLGEAPQPPDPHWPASPPWFSHVTVPRPPMALTHTTQACPLARPPAPTKTTFRGCSPQNVHFSPQHLTPQWLWRTPHMACPLARSPTPTKTTFQGCSPQNVQFSPQPLKRPENKSYNTK